MNFWAGGPMKSQFPIEKDIPLPPRNRNGKYPLPDMKIGDSFLVPKDSIKNENNLRTTICKYAKSIHVTVTVRAVPDGWRVWRVK
jgi:hypothetical protein